MAIDSDYLDITFECFNACRNGILINRVSNQDKEFHFQNWFQGRLEDLGVNFEPSGRNTYPDFTLVAKTQGFEVKGLAYPGREANYDSNSQVPTGFHNGRQIFYVFGRYPANPGTAEYPVVDLIICHGDFINATHDYVHKNKSIKGFGSYGDIMIRDRKMYVAPTPFGLTVGTTGQQTLIVPSDYEVDDRFTLVGNLTRTESNELVVGYDFNLKTNVLTPKLVANPAAGTEHLFRAYRMTGSALTAVTMKTNAEIRIEEELLNENE